MTGSLSILAFEHPSAGSQLVKGTIELGEPAERAALRELAEESGITDVEVVRSLGEFEVGPPRQLWHAFLCEADGLAENWSFRTRVDGGHDFRFFWHCLSEPADERWHLIFRQALREIQWRLNSDYNPLS